VYRRHSGVEGLIRVASDGALVAGVAFAVIGLGLYAALPGSQHLPVAAGATALALVLHVRHLRYALVGARPPAAGWTLAALAVIVVGPTPLIGAAWLQMFHVLAASAFLVLRLRWAIPAYLAIAAAAALWAVAANWDLPEPVAGTAAWFGLSVIGRGLAPIVLVWLVVALRQVDAMRHVLAREAVEMERRRIDDEFHRSVGEELESLVAQGLRATELVATDQARVEQELGCIVGASRRTLADARQLLRRSTLTARAELEGTVAILHAAGVDVALELPDGESPSTLDETVRASLRRLTAELLHTGAGGRVVVTLVDDHGALRLEYCTEPAETLREPGA
jgi:hypothetical protein